MDNIDVVRRKIQHLKDETKLNINSIHDKDGKAVLETTYEVLAGLEEALGTYAKG